MTENKNSFVVVLNNRNSRTDEYYTAMLLKKARGLGLTIAGEDWPDVRHGVEYAGTGNVLTFGTAKNHDVDWVRRPEYIAEKGYKPVYYIVEDWNTINTSLDKYADEKYGMRLSNGKRVTFHKDFVKIGTDIYTNREIGQITLRLR